MSCVPTAKQRMRLQELSTELFGVSSRWQKIQKSSRIPTAEIDRDNTVDPNQPKFKLTHRSPTIDEMIMALEDNVNAKRLRKLPEPELISSLAQQFLASELKVRMAVQIAEKDLAECEELFALLDAPVAERVKGFVVDGNFRQDGVFVVRGTEFLSELAYLKDPTLREPAALTGAAAGTDLHTSAEAAP